MDPRNSADAVSFTEKKNGRLCYTCILLTKTTERIQYLSGTLPPSPTGVTQSTPPDPLPRSKNSYSSNTQKIIFRMFTRTKKKNAIFIPGLGIHHLKQSATTIVIIIQQKWTLANSFFSFIFLSNFGSALSVVRQLFTELKLFKVNFWLKQNLPIVLT